MMKTYKIISVGMGGNPEDLGTVIESTYLQKVGKEISGDFFVIEAKEECLMGMQFFCNITFKEVK